MPLGEYLKAPSQALIVGEAGSGKSSLLRFVALDILADQPVLEAVKNRFAKAIPVWVPFALWVRMSIERGTPAPIEDVVTTSSACKAMPTSPTGCGALSAGKKASCFWSMGSMRPQIRQRPERWLRC